MAAPPSQTMPAPIATKQRTSSKVAEEPHAIVRLFPQTASDCSARARRSRTRIASDFASALTTDMAIFRRVAKVRQRCTRHIRAARSGGKVSAFALQVTADKSLCPPYNSTSAFRVPLRNLEHKARRRRMRNQPVFCISDARFGRGDAAAGVEHAALGSDHAARLAHAAHQ
jgi:hypothetical protein